MGKLLFMVGSYLLSSAFKTILLGAGIGLATQGFILVLINKYVDKSVFLFSGVGSDLMGLVGLSGLDVALSVIIGAIIARATIASLKIGISKSA